VTGTHSVQGTVRSYCTKAYDLFQIEGGSRFHSCNS